MRLNWHTITGSRNVAFFRKHTRIAVAYYGSHRFAIYEMRGPANADGSYADYYVVTDAHTVSDADVRAGKQPREVHRTTTLDLDAVIAWCNAQLAV